jgi:hypothetical protein
MGISTGRSSDSGNEFKLYSGIDRFTVLGVNPDLTTLNSWGIMRKQEPQYFGKTEDGTPYARITFVVKSSTIPELVTEATFFVAKEPRYNKDKTKFKVIDQFGNDAWATKDDVKNHRVLYSEKGARLKITQDYRAAYRGEIELTNFIKNLLNIADSHRYVNNVWELVDGADKLTCRFDDPKKWFDGDISEIANALTYQINNEIQLLAGVSTNKKGYLNQEIFTGFTARAKDKQATKNFIKEVNSLKKNKVSYTFEPIAEWEVKTATPEEIEAAVKATSDNDDDELPFDE